MPLATPHILIAEDDPADAVLATEALAEVAPTARVVHTPDARAALDLLRAQPRRLELCLLDLNMPGFGGLDVLAARQLDPVARLVPVVVFTTSSSPRDVAKAWELGANAVVTKPLDLDEYIATIGTIARFWLQVVALPERGP
ncbi:MAG: response regulator [Myxococcales bacterium]|nr:response regulator [Myxococcales bacterium]MCB9521064.1 response regulator [Myxococcales bacterium]